MSLNNSCDEILNNFQNGTIDIILSDDNRTITVRDTGRGIPISTYENTKLLFETLFASGKYDVSESTNSGVNGVGNTILQFSSVYFKCLSHMKSIGKSYEIVYENGGEITTPLTCLGDTDKHGTEITFKLDDTVYTEVEFNEKEVEDIIRRVSMISENITFNFTYKNNIITFNHNISEYFNKYSTDIIGESYTCSPKRFERDIEVERKGIKDTAKEIADIQVVFGACSSELPMQETMLNGNYLKENGTIYDGVVDGFKIYVNRYCKENNLYKKKEKGLSSQDIENAISFVCRLFNNLVEFESQVKFSTKKEYYKQIGKEYIQEQLEVYKLENQKAFKRMVDQILICKRANDVNVKARQELKEKLTKKIDVLNKIQGLYECKNRDGKRAFAICEGKSALSSLLFARPDNVAIMCIRGKMTNALKSGVDKILNDEIILNILRAYGVEISETKNVKKKNKDIIQFNIDNARYDEIYIVTDADIDGMGSIAPLLLTMFNTVAPEVVQKGIIHIIKTPLYEIQEIKDDKMYYAVDEDELESILKSLQGKRYKINYVKGLAECTKEGMQMCLQDNYRNKIQVRADNYEEVLKTLHLHMGKDVKPRYDYIVENFDRVNLVE